MLIVYHSKTGNTDKFISKLNHSEVFRIKDGCEIIKKPYILLTYTTGIGQVPKEIAQFLKNNSSFLKYVVGSGNRIWGESFCNAAKTISKQFNTPLLLTFELAGSSAEVARFKKKLAKL